jgi:lactoylglutathione lyase
MFPVTGRCRQFELWNVVPNQVPEFGGWTQMPAIEHVALWTENLDALRDWYARVLGALPSERYENAATGFSSYFLSFDGGARLELMSMPGQEPGLRAHVAFALGSAAQVAELAAELGAVEGPRTTGDGYYEAVVLDPDGNRVELTV